METKIYKVNSVLWAASVSLNFFWILNVFKEADEQVKDFLNFYPPVGPLLGLFVFSGVVFAVFLAVFGFVKPKSQKAAFLVYLISAIAFLFLVFPPVFKPIVGLLAF